MLTVSGEHRGAQETFPETLLWANLLWDLGSPMPSSFHPTGRQGASLWAGHSVPWSHRGPEMGVGSDGTQRQCRARCPPGLCSLGVLGAFLARTQHQESGVSGRGALGPLPCRGEPLGRTGAEGWLGQVVLPRQQGESTFALTGPEQEGRGVCACGSCGRGSRAVPVAPSGRGGRAVPESEKGLDSSGG